jgi:hypothetical protein
MALLRMYNDSTAEEDLVLHELDFAVACVVYPVDCPNGATLAFVCRGCGYVTPGCSACVRKSLDWTNARLAEGLSVECRRCPRGTGKRWRDVWDVVPLPSGGA